MGKTKSVATTAAAKATSKRHGSAGNKCVKTLYLDSAHFDLLKDLCSEDGISISKAVQDLIEAYLKERGSI